MLTMQAATAGVLHMKNGDQISGKIKKIWGGDVFIEPSYADEFAVDETIAIEQQSDPILVVFQTRKGIRCIS